MLTVPFPFVCSRIQGKGRSLGVWWFAGVCQLVAVAEAKVTRQTFSSFFFLSDGLQGLPPFFRQWSPPAWPTRGARPKWRDRERIPSVAHLLCARIILKQITI